jgi:hypothetical protein
MDLWRISYLIEFEVFGKTNGLNNINIKWDNDILNFSIKIMKVKMGESMML